MLERNMAGGRTNASIVADTVADERGDCESLLFVCHYLVPRRITAEGVVFTNAKVAIIADQQVCFTDQKCPTQYTWSVPMEHMSIP